MPEPVPSPGYPLRAAPVTRWTRRSSQPLGGGRLQLVEDAEEADVAVVNTCGFVEGPAKKDSVDAPS
ncbi:hypothetical protein GCM10023238_13300 [Streptomyces heliomycini]